MYMRPTLTENDPTNSPLAHAVACCQHSLQYTHSIVAPDSANDHGRKFRSGNMLASRGGEARYTAALATLSHLVCDVIEVSPQEQVIRAHAARIVALVQNMEVCWEWAIGQSVGDPLSMDTPLAYAEPPIAFAIGLAYPQPTFGGLLDARPEARPNIRPLIDSTRHRFPLPIGEIIPHTRLPRQHETVADLLAENAEHGVRA